MMNTTTMLSNRSDDRDHLPQFLEQVVEYPLLSYEEDQNPIKDNLHSNNNNLRRAA
jgi:hypothetical protein